MVERSLLQHEISPLNTQNSVIKSIASHSHINRGFVSSNFSHSYVPSNTCTDKTSVDGESLLHQSHPEFTPGSPSNWFHFIFADFEEARLIELIEDTFVDCNSMPIHCLLPEIRNIIGNNPHIFSIYVNKKGEVL